MNSGHTVATMHNTNSGCTEDGDDFWKIDVETTELEDGTGNETDIAQNSQDEESHSQIDVPSYDANFTGFLTEKEFCMETGKHVKNDAVPIKTCFNCLGDHILSDCPQKKNVATIAQNRKVILARKRNANVRYHEDVENKYSDFQPGVFSDALKHALRVRDNEIPEFVYRMRILGYPPGWLKEAEVQRSSVSLFDGSGKAVDHPEDEEGETDVNKVKYQPERLISFPGFNIPLPQGVIDQSRRYSLPEIQRNHSKDDFLKYMTINKAKKYKKRSFKLDESMRSPDSGVKLESSSIESEDCFNGSVFDSSDSILTERKQSQLSEEGRISDVGLSISQSKEEGELSEESNDGEDAGDDCPKSSTLIESHSIDSMDCFSSPQVSISDARSLSDASITSVQTPVSTPTNKPLGEKRKTTDSGENCSQLTEEEFRAGPKRHQGSLSKGFKLGVVLPESITQYSSLPDPDKWAVDVSDHILFDNLPEALGTWNKMKGIVKKVQNFMEKLHTEDE